MRRILCGLVLACAATTAAAQTGGPFDLTWNTIDGGGGLLAGGLYTLTGTVGQHDAGTMIGGAYTLAGGFWKGGAPLGTTAIGDDIAANALPREFAVHPAGPNPFRSATVLHFDLPSPRAVDVTIYDVRGGRVRQLVHAERPAGRHAQRWDGTDDAGRRAAPGVYLARVTAGEQRAETRMLRIR